MEVCVNDLHETWPRRKEFWVPVTVAMKALKEQTAEEGGYNNKAVPDVI